MKQVKDKQMKEFVEHKMEAEKLPFKSEAMWSFEKSR